MVRRARLALIAALPGLLILATGCAGQGPLPAAEAEPPVSVDRIRDTPDAFIGERVRLAAAVAEQHGSRVFTLKDDDPAFKEQMLVITTRPVGRLLGEERTTLRPGEKLLVSGTVRRGDLAELEADQGVQLDQKLRDRFEGKPVLVATELVRTDDVDPEAPDTAAGY